MLNNDGNQKHDLEKIIALSALKEFDLIQRILKWSKPEQSVGYGVYKG
jgi:hypothetical protein